MVPDRVERREGPGMTRTGMIREAYRAVEQAPSRFTGGTEYAQWAARADAWGESRFDTHGARVELS